MQQNHSVYNYKAETMQTIQKKKECKCADGMILDNDQRDAHLLYFTMYLLHSSTCFEHYILIIRRLTCIDAASGIVLSVSGRPVHRLREKWLE